jgi:hypothetical protein
MGLDGSRDCLPVQRGNAALERAQDAASRLRSSALRSTPQR